MSIKHKKHYRTIKCVLVLVAALSMLILSSCGSSKKEATDISGSSVVYEETETANIQNIEPTTIEDNSNLAEKENPDDLTCHMNWEPAVVHTISEYLQTIDSIFFPDESAFLGTNAISAYDSFIPEEVSRLKTLGGGSEGIRFALGLVDEDDMGRKISSRDETLVR